MSSGMFQVDSTRSASPDEEPPESPEPHAETAGPAVAAASPSPERWRKRRLPILSVVMPDPLVQADQPGCRPGGHGQPEGVAGQVEVEVGGKVGREQHLRRTAGGGAEGE